jgi:hypothetical protein
MNKTIRHRILWALLVGVICTLPSWAKDSVTISPLTTYSWGFSGGSAIPLNQDLKDQSEAYGKLSFNNNWYLTDYTSLFLDGNWFLPGNNFGGNLGVEFLAGDPHYAKVRPLLGLGVGTQIFERDDKPFGKGIGGSLNSHIGMLINASNSLQFRIRVPYQFVLNSYQDHTIGVEIGVLFSSPWKHIRKLNYQ